MHEPGREILRRYNILKAERGTFENNWQEIADHLLGRRDFVTKNVTGGRKRFSLIFDTTGLLSAELLAAALHSLLTNTATKWLRLKTEDDKLMDDEDVVEWLQDAESKTLTAFNSPRSRFSPQVAETYVDLVAFGTGSMFVGDEPGRGPIFSSRPLMEIVIDEDATGAIDTVFRAFPYTVRQAVQAFGAEAVPRAAQLLERNAEETIEFLHVVFRREDPNPSMLVVSSMPWQSMYLLRNEAKIVSTGGYFEMPYMVARWSKDAGELYGRGPGWISLPDQKMLNEMSKTVLTAAQKATDPPLLVADDSVLGQIRTAPGSLNTYRAGIFDEDPIRPLQSNARIDIGVEMIKQRQVNVQNAFFSQLLQLFQDPRMTATQVIELANQTQRLLSPMLGRLQVEMLEPMIDRVFGILLRSGKFLPPPMALSGQNIKVEYIGPVARSQKASDAQAIIDTFTVAASLVQVNPEAMDNLDTDEAIRLVARAKEVPMSILRRREDVAALREARTRLAEEQAQLEDVQTAAQAAGSAAPALKLVQGGAQGGPA